MIGLPLLPAAWARPVEDVHVFVESEIEPDVIGNPDGSLPAQQSTTSDTTWIADWDFEGIRRCDNQGWQRVDYRIANDGQVHWRVDDAFAGIGGIRGSAAVLGGSSSCWQGSGYCNDWYQAIRVEYIGASSLSFDHALDSEDGFDFLQIEVDPDCSSFEMVDYAAHPERSTRFHRQVLISRSGLETCGRIDGLVLPSFGEPATVDCAYIAFFSDVGFAPCDGQYESQLGAGLVVDQLALTGGTELFEDFEGLLDPAITFVNLHDSRPFGEWARLFPHPRDNQSCFENTSCAWVWTDHTTPTRALDPAWPSAQVASSCATGSTTPS